MGVGGNELVLVSMFAIPLGLIPAAIAYRRGRSFLGWWLFGTLFLYIALPLALWLPPVQATLDRRKLQSGYVRCPACGELIRQEASVCRYCGATHSASQAVAGAARPELSPPPPERMPEGEGSRCPRCDATMGPGDAFCGRCGQRLPGTCGECGASLLAGGDFCGWCGAPVGANAGD